MLFHALLAAGLPLTTALTHAALDSQPVAGELSLEKRQSICGVSGYDDDNYKPFEVIPKKACNAEQCSAYCKSRARCQSFAIGNDECKLYCEPVPATFKSGWSHQNGTGGLAEPSKYGNYDDEDLNEDFKYQYFNYQYFNHQYFNYQYFDYEDVNPRLVSRKSFNHCYSNHYEADYDSIDHSPHDSYSAATRYRIDGNQLIDASTSSIWSKNTGNVIDTVKTRGSIPANEIAISCEFLPETAPTLSCEDPTNTAVNQLGFCASRDNSLILLADGGADDCTFYNYRAVCETSPFTPPFFIRATDPATGNFLGYITAAYFSFGIRDLTATSSEALQVTYDPSSGQMGHPAQLTITSLNSAEYQDLTLLSILAFVQTSEDSPAQDMRSGSSNYGFFGNSQATPRGQTSQEVDNSIQRAVDVLLPSQTAIWTVNGITNELSARWINTPDVPPATLVAMLNSNGGNGVYFTGDAQALMDRFPGETWQRLRLTLVPVETLVG
ncbi:hypothetical protein TI39_contig4164g00014 [Zymoseptoria brevis]|uniref:Apple domain-containing protein n=1 Tax=Zymoseptoria brevis TaxID=1047168 RepID=A0A0F4GBD6_9PEZI|nr:hypothetical protein TI39_contig4164g00014 [Zymoseptoria brevis]